MDCGSCPLSRSELRGSEERWGDFTEAEPQIPLFVSASGVGLLVLSSSHSQGMCSPDFRDRSPRELREDSMGRRIRRKNIVTQALWCQHENYAAHEEIFKGISLVAHK